MPSATQNDTSCHDHICHHDCCYNLYWLAEPQERHLEKADRNVTCLGDNQKESGNQIAEGLCLDSCAEGFAALCAHDVMWLPVHIRIMENIRWKLL